MTVLTRANWRVSRLHGYSKQLDTETSPAAHLGNVFTRNGIEKRVWRVPNPSVDGDIYRSSAGRTRTAQYLNSGIFP